MDYPRELDYFATMSKRNPESRREALIAFMELRGMKPGPWARASGVPPTTLYAFLQGRTNDMGAGVYEALAAEAQTSVDELLGNIDEARDRILRAAERLFSERPIEQVTTSVICDAAKVRASAFSAYFNDPMDVLFHINQRRLRQTIEDVRRLAPVYGTLRDRLTYALRTIAQFELDRPSQTKALKAFSFRCTPELERQEHDTNEAFCRTLVEMLELAARAGEIKQVDYAAASRAVIAVYHQALKHALSNSKTADQLSEESLPELDILLNGVGFNQP